MPRTPKSKTSPQLLAVFHCVFLVMCLFFAYAFARDGSGAIRTRTYTLHYTESTSWAFGPAWGGSSVKEGIVEYRDKAATIFGIGFVSVGAMLASWAAGLALRLLGEAGCSVPDAAYRLVGAVALAALLTGCIALFPPWRLHAISLYLVVAVFVLAIVLPIPDKLRKQVFPAVVLLVVLAGFTAFPAFPILAGILVFLILVTNLVVLWPGISARLTKNQSESG